MKTMVAMVALCGIALAGCAERGDRYDNPIASQSQFLADRAACLRQAQEVFSASSNVYGGTSNGRVVADCIVLKSCMQGLGYTSDPQGALYARSEPAVECRK